jgi:hypothetical protein
MNHVQQCCDVWLQLFVAGFPAGTEAQEVGLLFNKYGEVAHVRLSARGVGRVVFQGPEAIQASLVLNATDYKGSKLRVEQQYVLYWYIVVEIFVTGILYCECQSPISFWPKIPAPSPCQQRWCCPRCRPRCCQDTVRHIPATSFIVSAL